MTPEEHRDAIWAILHAMAERENQMEIRFNQRMEKADERMDRADERMDRAEKRSDKIDRQLQATAKLVQAGIKMVQEMIQQQRVIKAETAELRKATKAFIDRWERSRGNGHGPNGSSKK